MRRCSVGQRRAIELHRPKSLLIERDRLGRVAHDQVRGDTPVVRLGSLDGHVSSSFAHRRLAPALLMGEAEAKTPGNSFIYCCGLGMLAKNSAAFFCISSGV